MHRLLENDTPRGWRGLLTLPSILTWAGAVLILGLVSASVDWGFVASLDFTAIWPYRIALLKGLGVTLTVSITAVFLGLIMGTLLTILASSRIKPIRWLVMAWVEVARNLPLAVSLFWVHFALPHLTGVTTTALQSGLIAIVFQASGYLADIARAGIQAVPRGQSEASYVLGLTAWVKWTRIILPQALKVALPPLAGVAISFFKASSILSVLSVGELMSVGLRVAESNFRPIETLTFCGLIYILLGTLFSRGTQRLERFSRETARKEP